MAMVVVAEWKDLTVSEEKRRGFISPWRLLNNQLID